MSIEWKDLNYTLTQKGCFKKAATKTILNGCSGFLPAGRLLAVMGPSGSGKTSFLNVLADRVPKNSGTNVTGEVFIGGTPRTQIGEFSRLASYVLQDDSLYPMLTVFETLFLAARLRLPANISLEDKRARVESLIDELGIRAARDVVIGDEKHKGVSGGERKRTNVGVEIIGDPSLIFLDEPTSGLDAFQALNVMQLLNSLASQRGRTVCVSIHQPRSSIYSLFDRLLLLASGSVIYSGDAAKAVDYFAKHGHACPVHYNPADYFIDLVSVDTSRSAVGGTAKASDDHIRIDALLEAAAAAQASGEFGGGGSGGSGGGGGGGGGSSSAAFAARAGVLKMSGGCACTGRYHSSLIEQSVLLYMRSLSSRLRDKPALIAPLFASTFFSLVFSALYSEMNLSQKSIQDRTGALFFVTINQAFGGVFSVANTFPLGEEDRRPRAYLRSVRRAPLLPCQVAGRVPVCGARPDGLCVRLVLDRRLCPRGRQLSRLLRRDRHDQHDGGLVGDADLVERQFRRAGDGLRPARHHRLPPLRRLLRQHRQHPGLDLVDQRDLLLQVGLPGHGHQRILRARTASSAVTTRSAVTTLFSAVASPRLLLPVPPLSRAQRSCSPRVVSPDRRRPPQDLVFVNADGTPCTEVIAKNVSFGPKSCAFVDGKQVLTLLTFEDGTVAQSVLFLAIIAAIVHTLAYLCLVSKRQKFAPLMPPPTGGTHTSKTQAVAYDKNTSTLPEEETVASAA